MQIIAALFVQDDDQFTWFHCNALWQYLLILPEEKISLLFYLQEIAGITKQLEPLAGSAASTGFLGNKVMNSAHGGREMEAFNAWKNMLNTEYI